MQPSSEADKIHYIISSYPGRLPSRKCTQVAAEVLHLHLGSLLALLEEKAERGLPSFLGQVTVVVTPCKAQHQPAFENFYCQEGWTREFSLRAPGLPLVFLPYRGENRHYSYDQWLQAMTAFPAFSHHLLVEEDYAPYPSTLDFDSLLLEEYRRVFPDGVGYLCALELEDATNGRNAAISNGLVSRETLASLGGDPLSLYYSSEGYPQVTFDRLFRPHVADMSGVFAAFFWDTPSASLLDLSEKSFRLRSLDAGARTVARKLGLVPVQLLDRELSSPCLPFPPEYSTVANYRNETLPLRSLALDVRAFLWEKNELKVSDLVGGVSQGGRFPPPGEKDLVFCILSHARPNENPRGVLSGEERIALTLSQCQSLRLRYPQAGIYLLDSTQLTVGDIKSLGQYVDWVFLLGKDENAVNFCKEGPSSGECYSLVSFLSLPLRFRRLVKLTSRFLPTGEVVEWEDYDRPVFHLTPAHRSWAKRPAFCTVAYMIPWEWKENFLSFYLRYLRGERWETPPSENIKPEERTPALDVEHQMCAYFYPSISQLNVVDKIGFVGLASNGTQVYF